MFFYVLRKLMLSKMSPVKQQYQAVCLLGLSQTSLVKLTRRATENNKLLQFSASWNNLKCNIDLRGKTQTTYCAKTNM